MNDFTLWRSWAGAVDDAAFAQLWRALGTVASLHPTEGAPSDWISRVFGEAIRRQELHWSIPHFNDPLSLVFQDFPAQVWIDGWQKKIGARLDKTPLRIERWPEDEALGTWLGTLTDIAPVASLRLGSRHKRMLGWPLRLATLQEDLRGEMGQLSTVWPSNRLTRIVGDHGECFACDVLVYRGEIDTLLPQLDGGAVSASLFVLCAQRSLHADDFAKLDELLDVTEAAGYIVIEPDPGNDLIDRLNHFVVELSHARRVDVAACLAFAGLAPPALIGFGDALAHFTIEKVAGRLLERSRILDRAAKLPAAARGVLGAVISRIPTPPLPSAPGPTGLEALGDDSRDTGGGLEGFGADDEGAAVGADDAVEMAPTGAAPTADEDRIPDYERVEGPYDRESHGASTLAEAVEALDHAEASVSAARYLQQESFILSNGKREKALSGFVADQPALIDVYIGPPDPGVDRLDEAFPEDALPQELQSWDLQVWLSEPDYIPVPMQGDIKLPRSGTSSKFEFRFLPGHAGTFNARISVLHRGRVIQTAGLRASVNAPGVVPADTLAPALASCLRVKQNLSELDRRRFDLAYVLNHAGTDQPVAHAMGENRAWLSNLRVVEKTVKDINVQLSDVARTARDYAGGLDSAKGKALLRNLAELGSYLHLYLIEPPRPGAGGVAQRKLFEGEFIQIVSTRSDAIVIPFEFIYEYDAPSEDAELCPHWRDAIKAGRCPATCQHDEETYCPMGFWGLSKVIERHALQADLATEGEVGLQSEPVAGRDTLKISGDAVFGCSTRVKDAQLEPLRQRLLAAQLNAGQAADWKDWKTRVGQGSPSLLIALAHSDGSGRSATIEIGGKPIKTIGITVGHICANAETAERPLVALLGCDMAGTGDDYANPVAVFMTRGAAAVVGTIATVLAEDSADVAARLLQGMTFADRTQTRRLGEAMRDLKRNALLDGELMPLCLAGFGDADWLLSN
jgi:hypothetical protein